jgi:hypothetical protein
MAGMDGTADGQLVRSDVDGIMLTCQRCGGRLRFLVRYHGELLCRACVGAESTRRARA